MPRWPWDTSASPQRTPRTGRARLGRWLLGIFVAILLLALLTKLAGPPIIEHFVEKSLEDMPGGYRGTIEHVELRMLAAEVALVGLNIAKKEGAIPVPFMNTELVMGTVLEGAKPRTTLRFVRPVINYVDAKNEAKKQTGPEVKLEEIREQLPFELIQANIDDAEIHYRNYDAKPPLDAVISGFSLAWTDLVGCMPPGSTACRSRVEGKGALLDGGGLALAGTFSREPAVTFDGKVAIRKLQLRDVSPLLKHYAKVDIQKGRLELDGKLTQKGETKRAFLVPRLDDVEVMGGDDKDTSFFRELGAAAAAGWFERKSGKKAIAVSSSAGGKPKFEVVDLKDADEKKSD